MRRGLAGSLGAIARPGSVEIVDPVAVNKELKGGHSGQEGGSEEATAEHDREKACCDGLSCKRRDPHRPNAGGVAPAPQPTSVPERGMDNVFPWSASARQPADWVHCGASWARRPTEPGVALVIVQHLESTSRA